MRKIFLEKKGVFFSIDALLALIVILSILAISLIANTDVKTNTEIHSDFLKVLSSLKVEEANNTYLKSLISSGIINSSNKSVLEQIAELYVENKTLAKNLANSFLDEVETNRNIGIWFGNNLIASKNSTPIESSSDIKTIRTIVSGIKEGESITGYSARSFLSSSMKNKFFNFGGYVGDGNISVNVSYTGNLLNADMELVINDDFELYVNGNFEGVFNGSPDGFTPVSYEIPIENFSSGDNLIEFKGEKLYIAGGYIRLRYQEEGVFPYYFYSFPGINGLINLYDSFYVPGDLNEMNIILHLDSLYNVFLTIGNLTLFRNNTLGEQYIIFNNSFLSSQLNYAALSKTTVPLRLGMENVSFVVEGIPTFADVFSVTDLSGSMRGNKIDNAKQANDALIDTVLNLSGNRVGLIGYRSNVYGSDTHELSNNSDSLHAEVNSWNAGGGTCICCGINAAINMFNKKVFEPGVITSRVSQSNDDAEERLNHNNMYLTSSDLEFVRDGSRQQEIGMRFQNINVPQGSIISSAYIEFETDETSSETTNLVFYAENSDNASEFSSSKRDITNRPKTDVYVEWNDVPPWNVISEKHQTPNLSLIIQEIVNRSDWVAGNSIVIIVNGTGKRVAESFDGESENAPLLILTYRPKDCGNSVIDSGEECDDGNFDNNDQCTNLCKLPRCGDGVKNATEECDDGNLENGDGCSSQCELENRLKSMIVMSDGKATVNCHTYTYCGGDSACLRQASDDAINASCTAYKEYNITVHAVGFGSDANETTLQSIAACGYGDYYFANVTDIVDIYKNLAETIIQATYSEQTIESTGNISTILYPDSYIKMDYTPEAPPFGVMITLDQGFFNLYEGNFSLPPNSTIAEARAISYSGARWTDNVFLNGNSVFNLSSYGSSYIELGDPYTIYLPVSFINKDNNVRITTGTSPENSSEGSLYNKIIYKVSKNVSAYSTIAPLSEGCNWEIEFEDETTTNIAVPSNYTGSNSCSFTSSLENYDTNDAAQIAIYELLKVLDLDNDHKLDIKLTEQDLNLNLIEMVGIPYTWSTEVQVRTWF